MDMPAMSRRKKSNTIECTTCHLRFSHYHKSIKLFDNFVMIIFSSNLFLGHVLSRGFPIACASIIRLIIEIFRDSVILVRSSAFQDCETIPRFSVLVPLSTVAAA
uniref:Uncharacterized protein n=1 Tax=Corethron hystrix TaxID=216773 RepID=A0A7S1BP18_9STRA